MTFSKISVLVPTRGRVAHLQRLIASYRATVGPGMAELVFRIDDDDAASMAFLQTTNYMVMCGPRLDGYRSLPVFFNEMATLASGHLLMCGNDDLEFVTPDWPARVLDVANQYPDGVFDLAVATLNAANVPFSIVSKAAVQQIGHLHDPRIYWGDVYLRDIFAAFGRVIPVPSVEVTHHWMGHTPDQTFTEAQQERYGAFIYSDVHKQAVDDAVAKLAVAA